MVAMMALGFGKWDEVGQSCQDVVEIANSLRDWRGWELGQIVRADMHLIQGHLTSACATYGSCMTSAKSRGDIQIQMWAQLGLAVAYWYKGSVSEFFGAVEECEMLVAENAGSMDIAAQTIAYAAVALTRLYRGNLKGNFLLDAGAALLTIQTHQYRTYFGFQMLLWAHFAVLESNALPPRGAWEGDMNRGWNVHPMSAPDPLMLAKTAKTAPHLGFKAGPKKSQQKKRGPGGLLGTNNHRLYVLGTGSGLGGAQPLGEALNLDHHKLEKRTRELLRHLHGMKCSMPVTEPGYKRYKGLFLRITQGDGKASGVKPAVEKFKFALAKAQNLGLALETGLCHYEIGR